MSRFHFMNGWKDAPHCWRNHIFSPPKFDFAPHFISFAWLGFVVFWTPKKIRYPKSG